jgi:hypothetical protein
MKSSPETIRQHMGWPEPEPVESTIDHAARAQRLLTAAADLPSENTELPHVLAEAQVEATLALAYEQRTANLMNANKRFGLFSSGEILNRLDAS